MISCGIATNIKCTNDDDDYKTIGMLKIVADIICIVVLHTKECCIQRNDFIYSSNEAGKFNVGGSVLRPLNRRVIRTSTTTSLFRKRAGSNQSAHQCHSVSDTLHSIQIHPPQELYSTTKEQRTMNNNKHYNRHVYKFASPSQLN